MAHRPSRLSPLGRHRPAGRLRCQVHNHVPPGSELHAAWDELARAQGEPTCTPAWMLAWWRHARPAGARLRVVAVRHGSRVVAVAPLYVERVGANLHRYRVLGARLAGRAMPLVADGWWEAAAPVLARGLAALDPRPDLLQLEAVPVAHGWPDRLQALWPTARRPRLVVHHPSAAPSVSLHRPPGEWEASRSRSFRRNLRRRRRRLEEAGAVLRLAGPGQLSADLQTFARLHHQRWAPRGGSAHLDDTVLTAVGDAARELLPHDGFRLWVLELDGAPAAAEVLIAAGGLVIAWLGGFDERWRTLQPSLQTLVHAVADAHRRGERRVSLGTGDLDYKRRMADGEELLTDAVLLPPGPAVPVAWARHHLGLWRHRLADRRQAPGLRDGAAEGPGGGGRADTLGAHGA